VAAPRAGAAGACTLAVNPCARLCPGKVIESLRDKITMVVILSRMVHDKITTVVRLFCHVTE